MSTAKFTTLATLDGNFSVPSETLARAACRAWVNFNGTGTVAIRASFNVSSITDNGVGNFAVNLTTAMPDTNGAAAGSAYENSTGTFTAAQRCVMCSFASSSTLGVFVTFQNGGVSDTIFTTVAIFR